MPSSARDWLMCVSSWATCAPARASSFARSAARPQRGASAAAGFRARGEQFRRSAWLLLLVQSGARKSRPVALLLGERLAGAAQLLGEVLELGEAIFHGQHCRLVVDVHPGFKRKFRDRRRVDVNQTPLRVPRQQMAAAGLAPLPVAPLV